jgi:hypothetical protein
MLESSRVESVVSRSAFIALTACHRILNELLVLN